MMSFIAYLCDLSYSAWTVTSVDGIISVCVVLFRFDFDFLYAKIFLCGQYFRFGFASSE